MRGEKKKPWEETWTYSSDPNDGVQIHVETRPKEWELVLEHGWQTSDVKDSVMEARGKLASAAPEMASVLLELEDSNERPCTAEGERSEHEERGARLVALSERIEKALQKAGVKS